MDIEKVSPCNERRKFTQLSCIVKVKGLLRELSAFQHRREVKAPLRECV
jgi:hypothetical protein